MAVIFGLVAIMITKQDDIQVRNVGVGSNSDIGGSIDLINNKGNPITSSKLRGKFLVVFFGFTNCPDVCPLTMNTISEMLDLLGKQAKKVQALFITIDPERDTPHQLDQFVIAFDQRIMALTGTNEQIRNVADAYKVFYQLNTINNNVNESDLQTDYQVNHTAITYFMSPTGNFLKHFPYNTNPEDMASAILNYLLTTLAIMLY